MRALALIIASSILHSAGQEPLQADPASDIFTAAQMAYQQAASAKGSDAQKAEFAMAEHWLNKFLAEFPSHQNSAQAYYYLASAQSQQGKKPEAIQSYAEILKRTKSGEMAGTAAIQVGYTVFQSGNKQEALPYLDIATRELAKGKSKTFAHYLRALCLQNSGRSSDYLSSLDYVLSQKNGSKFHDRCSFLKAGTYLKTEQYSKALALYEKCAQSSNSEIKTQSIHKCALLAQQLGKSSDTLKYFSTVLDTPALKQHHPKSALILLNSYAQSQKWKQALTLEPYGTEGLTSSQIQSRSLLLAKSYDNLDQWTKALPYYQAVAKSASGSDLGFNVSYLLLSKFTPETLPLDSANDFLSTYQSQSNEKYHGILLLKAETLFQQGKLKDALPVYQSIKASLLSSENQKTIAYRICYLLLNSASPERSIPAIVSFTSEHADDKRTPHLLFDLAGLYTTQTEYSKAIQAYTTAAAHSFTTPEITLIGRQQIAKLYTKVEDYPAAAQAYQLLLDKHQKGQEASTLSEWTFWHGVSSFKIQDWATAKVALRQTRPVSTYATESTQYLALLAYQQKDATELLDELKHYESLSSKPLATPLYLYVAVENMKSQSYPNAWWGFTRSIKPTTPESYSTLDPVILEAYAECAHQLKQYQELKLMTAYLKQVELPAYRKVLNLYRSGLALYHSEGAAAAQTDVEDAVRMNPGGTLKYDLLLLAGQIEHGLGHTANASRLLKQVVYFSAPEQKTAKIQALELLIKSAQQSSDNQEELAGYQKELELLR